MKCDFKPCPLEINSTRRLKPEHLESSSSTTKIIISPIPPGYGHQTWQGCELPWGARSHKVIWPFDHMAFQNHVTNSKHISTTRVPMPNKLNSIASYRDELLPIKSHDTFITLSWKITWQTKIIKSPLTMCLWPLGKMVTYLEQLLTIKFCDALIMWNCEITWQTKTFTSPLPQCLWPPKLVGWVPTHIVTWPFNHVV